LLALLKGGGGSSFCPAFAELEKSPPDIAIFLTDGDITVPPSLPANLAHTKVFWAVINQGRGHGNRAPTEAYGMTLKID
jgi:predicted metal-dependent peptidase